MLTDSAASAPSPPGNPAPPNVYRLPAASPLGRADEQPPPLAPRRLLLIMASGSAGPLDHPSGVLFPHRESHGRDRLHPSLGPRRLPPRRSRWYPSRPTTTAPSH